MRTAVLAFAAGVWLVQQLAQLPSGSALALLAGACAALAAAAWRGARRAPFAAWALVTLACLGAGFAFAAGAAQLRLADRLDREWEGRDVTLTGVVSSLPQPFERGVRFEFEVERAEPSAFRAPGRILLAWYNGLTPEEFQEVLPVRAGERWRLTVRLRRPHGGANPHGYDYELALLERDIGATGYVRPRGERARLAPMVWTPALAIERAREAIRARLWDALPEHRYAGIVIALAIGDQRAIETVDWETFTRTGVGHLMSISGLHVTMVAGLFAALVAVLWRRSTRLVLRLPVRKAAAVAAVLGAAGYTLLAGFAVPAQRTLYMVTVVAVALWLDRTQSSTRVLAAALAIVLVLDPWAAVAPGFWLSFGAVALMLYVADGGGVRRHWLAQWGRTQWAISVGLAPLVLLLFQQVSLVAPLANAIAIPVVSLVVTPLALAAAVTPGPWVAAAAHMVLAALMPALDALAQLPGAAWRQHAPAPWTVGLAALGVAWLLAPRGVPARFAAPLLLAPLFAVRPAPPAEGEIRITVLDVGQGLAALVRTRDHALLYDAGPAWGADADAGSRVVVPFLRGEGLERLDAVVVTHDDSDHAGGARSVMRTFPTGALWSSLDPGHPAHVHAPYRLPCRAGVGWRWGAIDFEFLHPLGASHGDPQVPPNSRSCVLRVGGPGGVVLLTGDIEARDERALLARAAVPRADLLLVPHHGSGTSSSPAFVAAVRPAHAVFATGYRNRFGHPKPEVAARYAAAGAALWRTDRDGAVTIVLANARPAVSPFRETRRRYWR
jgi:competence protein ComEC